MSKKTINIGRADSLKNSEEAGNTNMSSVRRNLFEALTSVVYENGWTQAETAKMPGFNTSRAHHLFSGKISNFSANTLIYLLLCSGFNIEVSRGSLPDGGILKELRKVRTRKIDLDSYKTIHFSADQLKMLSAMYAAGDSLTNIGKSFGISRDAVASRLATIGVEIRKAGRPARATPEILVKIIAMRDSGKAWSEISRDLGFKPRYLQVLYRSVKRVV